MYEVLDVTFFKRLSYLRSQRPATAYICVFNLLNYPRALFNTMWHHFCQTNFTTTTKIDLF